MAWQSEKDRVFDMMEGVIAVLAVELGHEPTTPEILTRLALLSGCYIGGAAQNVSDPDAFIAKSIESIEHTARAVHRELTETTH